MFKKLCLFLLFIFLGTDFAHAADKIKVVATTSTFANIVQEVSGDKAEIYFIASPNRDIHFIDPTPKDVMKMRAADIFVHAGLDLESWRGSLVDAVGKSDFLWPGGKKQIDVSQGILLLEIPTNLSRIQGDLHAYGNPHYWLDPLNAKVIALNIAEGMGEIYPQDADFFRRNAEEFSKKLDEKMKAWESEIAPYRGTAIVTYHKSWSYFAKRFGFEIAGYIEPKPGIPPTARHFQELAGVMKEKNVRLVVKEIYTEKRAAKKVAHEAGVPLVTLLQFPGEEKTASYIGTMDENVKSIVNALSKNK